MNSVRPPVRRSIRRLVLWVGPVLLLIAAWQVWDAVEGRRLSTAVAQAFPEGLGDSADVVSPREDDAARFYAAAAAAVVAPREDARYFVSEVLWGGREALSAGNKTPTSGAEAARLDVGRNALSLGLVDRAMALAFGHFNPGTEFNYRSSNFITLANLSAVQTLDLVRQGNAEDAVDSLIARVQLLRVFEAEHGLLSVSLTGSQLQGIAADLALVIARADPSDASLAGMSRTFAEASRTGDVDAAIKGTAASLFEIVQSTWSGRSTRYSTPWGFFARPVLRHHAVSMLQMTAEARRAARLPWPDRIEAMKNIPEHRSRLPEIVSFIASWRVLSSYQDATRRSGAGVAALRCARLALALELYRRQRGSLPERLEGLHADLGADAILDPFTGKPLIYRVDRNSYVLYSVGPDGRDDGGKISPQPVRGRVPGTGPIPDIGVRVARNSTRSAR